MATLVRMTESHERDRLREAFAERLQQALKDLGVDTPTKQKAWISKKMGISREGARKWLQALSKPDEAKFERLADHLRVDIGWLRDGRRPLINNFFERPPAPGPKASTAPIRAYDVDAIEDGDPVPDGWQEVQHIDFALSAGDGSEVPSFVETKYPMYYRMDWFHRCGAKPANVKSMSVRGDSMQFTLYDRDRVAVHTADRVVVSNAVYALLLDGEACVKRLFRHGQGLRIVSDNPDKGRYPDIIIAPEELHDRVSIIGRVIDKSGAGGL